MAKKKTTVRRVPRSTTPRTFSDGQAAAPAADIEAPVAAPANGVSAARPAAQDVRRRAAGRSSETRPQVPLEEEYAYVPGDLRRLGLIAGAMIAIMVVLGLIVH